MLVTVFSCYFLCVYTAALAHSASISLHHVINVSFYTFPKLLSICAYCQLAVENLLNCMQVSRTLLHDGASLHRLVDSLILDT